MLSLIFMGTPDLACASLRALLNAPEIKITAVVTQPDRPVGRNPLPQPPPVKKTAIEAGIPVLQPERARNPEFVEQLRAFAPDLIVVAAFGQILPKAILDMPRFGCLNVHTSLLPKYRGAAPIQWAILNGDAQTGVTLMKMAPALDVGDILAQSTTAIEPSDNAETLHDRLADMGATLLVQTVQDYVAGKIIPRPQNESEATYVGKISKEDGRLNWSLPARVLWNRIRGFTPWPGAFTFIPATPKPRLLKIWRAQVEEHFNGAPGHILSADKTGIVIACGSGALRVLELQREGGRRMNAQDFLAGHPFKPGDPLSTT
jgi:methionyl-tRNA formyltransferase